LIRPWHGSQGRQRSDDALTMVRGYSHREREIATDMAADVLSLVAAETILSLGGKIACTPRKQHWGRWV
jgi:hypothetical protein